MCRPVRAIWVARFHYRLPDDIPTIIENCAALGCNTVLWQVRGEGTVSYPSRYEPWGREFNFRDPGFDPLALAIEEAHKRGLRLEAWFNVTPGWRGATPPPIREQLYNAHPDWFIQDAAGRRQPPGDFYMILNPCLPEVRRHITSLVDELASNYNIDGIHLDYVRFAWDGLKNAKNNYPRDARTLSLFERETGSTPEQNANAWHAWRANQLTRLVTDIRNTVNRRRPGATLTAAVWGDPREGYWDFLQNGVGWLRVGLLDAAMPMAYREKLSAFEEDVQQYRDLGGHRVVAPGLGVYMHRTAEQMGSQLASCNRAGGDFALFSYESFFPTANDRATAAKTGAVSAAEQQLRYMRRDVLKAALR
jgi:uncharacterized lipoprotein YddW (UPF0748 family)